MRREATGPLSPARGRGGPGGGPPGGRRPTSRYPHLRCQPKQPSRRPAVARGPVGMELGCLVLGQHVGALQARPSVLRPCVLRRSSVRQRPYRARPRTSRRAAARSPTTSAEGTCPRGSRSATAFGFRARISTRPCSTASGSASIAFSIATCYGGESPSCWRRTRPARRHRRTWLRGWPTSTARSVASSTPWRPDRMICRAFGARWPPWSENVPGSTGR